MQAARRPHDQPGQLLVLERGQTPRRGRRPVRRVKRRAGQRSATRRARPSAPSSPARPRPPPTPERAAAPPSRITPVPVIVSCISQNKRVVRQAPRRRARADATPRRSARGPSSRAAARRPARAGCAPEADASDGRQDGGEDDVMHRARREQGRPQRAERADEQEQQRPPAQTGASPRSSIRARRSHHQPASAPSSGEQHRIGIPARRASRPGRAPVRNRATSPRPADARMPRGACGQAAGGEAAGAGAGAGRVGVIRQMVFDRSSATISAPRGSTVTPTGRPRVLPSFRKPVTKSTGLPAGRPPRKGTKTTLVADRRRRGSSCHARRRTRRRRSAPPIAGAREGDAERGVVRAQAVVGPHRRARPSPDSCGWTRGSTFWPPIGIGPAVEAALAHRGQIVGDEVGAELVALVDHRPQLPAAGLDGQRGRVAQAGGVGAVGAGLRHRPARPWRGSSSAAMPRSPMLLLEPMPT